MRVPRLYIPHPLSEGNTHVLNARAAHHIMRVLRLGPGARLQLFDGQGREHAATLLDGHKTEPSVVVGEKLLNNRESSLSVTLGQGIPRRDRMDFILQKAVELGVARIQPLWMQRSQTRLKGHAEDRRMRHWNNVVISASEQSGRARLPGLDEPADFESWLAADLPGELRVMLHPESELSLRHLQRPVSGILLLVGPEGGFSPEEQSQAAAAGITSVRLGPRILRTETAAMAALASLQALWGDFD